MKTQAPAVRKAVPTGPLAAWTISEADYPYAGDAWEKLSFYLNYAILAPSSHNSQPWRFKLNLDEIRFFADATRALPVIDPQRRELMMSCGTALFHLRLAIRYFGHSDEVAIFPEDADPDLVAVIEAGSTRGTTAHERSMFESICRRRTNRLPFDAQPIPPLVLGLLQEEAAHEEAALMVFPHADDRRLVARLVCEGDSAQLSNPSFRKELSAWIHSANSARRDGIPGYACGPQLLPEFATPVYALAVQKLDISKRTANHDRELIEHSPALAVLVTPTDTREAWLAAGQALARVLLMASAYGVSASFVNQPIQSAHLRSQLRESLSLTGFPQTILRLGYGPLVKATPRRDIHDFLI